ncbi:MAG: PE-PGRS family protein [Polyangiaceae bacterium]|nr:PE-PGRS family protein [Polyangiaceae bacterium]
MERHRRWGPWVVAAVTVTAASPPARAEGTTPRVDVATAAELTAAVAAAQPGDVIVLAPGTYALGKLSCAASGTPTAPIVVRAATPRGARLEFSSVEGFAVTGAHWRFEGLDVRGTCAQDDDCEHAFHVSGAADGFVLRDSRIVDFNAQLKVNAAQVGGVWRTPNAGLVEHNELADTRARNTANPTTKLNIDTGDDWVVRGNFLHDFHKGGGNQVSYGVFLKSGGARGVVERNLVVCSLDVTSAGATIGLSLGGGGTAPQFCAPAFDAATPCAVEHRDGVLRNNVVANCSDVGIYLNRAANTRVLYNTLIATSGVDFRFDTTTGVAIGNFLGGSLRERDGGTFTGTANLAGVALSTFTALYAAPLVGDLSLVGDPAAVLGAGPAETDVVDDYCGRLRSTTVHDLGALEHGLGDCGTLPLPGSGGTGGGSGGSAGTSGSGGSAGNGGGTTGAGGTAGAGPAGGGGSASGGGGSGNGGVPSSGATGGAAGADAGAGATPGGGDEGGCACRAAPGAAGAIGAWRALAGGAALVVARRRRRRAAP